MKIKQFLGAIGVTGLAVSIAGSMYFLAPLPQVSKPFPALEANGGVLQLACLGGAKRLVDDTVSVEQVTENLTGKALGLVKVETPANLDATHADTAGVIWQPFSAVQKVETNETTPNTATPESNKVALANAVFPASVASKNELGLAQLQGLIEVDRQYATQGIVTATSLHSATAGDLRGLASNPCAWGVENAWLVGASSAVGTSGELRLANPSLNPVTITINAFGSKGRLSLGSNSRINLSPREVRSFPLAGLVPSDEQIAFQLKSTNGKFAATLFHNELAGFTPQGVDFLAAAKGGRELYIPGLYLVPNKLKTGDVTVAPQTLTDSQLPDPQVQAKLRIVNPHKDLRIVQVATLDSDGKWVELPGATNLAIPPQSVFDLDLAGLPAGAHTLRLTADADISAGAEVRYGNETTGKDKAWIAAQTALTNGSASFMAGNAKLIVGTSQPGKLKWQAYDTNGIQIDTGELAVAGTVTLDLPQSANFLTFQANVELVGGVYQQLELADGLGIDVVPLLNDISASASFRFASQR